MRRALEKFTFFVLSLAAASVISFALLARMADRGAPPPCPLPLLVNTSPRDARDLALAAVRAAAGIGPAADRARAELARLGGAALPHVLPLLESLDPEARGRVALALAPVARRMGVAGDDDFTTAERAVVFFTRFWQDRSADFRAAAVRRKVQRLAERALPLRRKEVIELDTFALGDLFDALGRVRDVEDVKRIERLGPVLSHITSAAFPLPPSPTVDQAARAATAWRDWGFDHGADFATLDGPARLAATVLETRYFRFLAGVPRAARGDDPAGNARLREVLERARTSVPLALLALALAVGASTLLARWLAHTERSEERVVLAATLMASLPLTGLATRGAALGAIGIVGVLALGLTALLVLELHAARRQGGRFRRAVAYAGTLLPLTLAAELAAEALLGRGLGSLTRSALLRSDLEGLMWIGAVLSATGSLAILLPDARSTTNAIGVAPGALVPARVRPRAFAALAAVVGSFALGALIEPASGAAISVLARAAGVTLVTTGIATLTAGVVALFLGVLAGGISRASDLFLSRLLEVSAALPQPLIACATFTFGSLTGALLLGGLRGIEVGHLLRRRLIERRAVEDIEPPSFGHAPLSPYLKRVLPLALGPAAVSLALTGSWVAALEGAGAGLGAPTTPSLSGLAASPGGVGVVALLLVWLLTATLCMLVRNIAPREHDEETPGSPWALPLRRRVDSSRPPAAAPGSNDP
jgi:peptide/nickel transport system permease protein